MRLVYDRTGLPVRVGDRVIAGDAAFIVADFRPPHKPSSSGKVALARPGGRSACFEYYVSVIGATWIEREDQQP